MFQGIKYVTVDQYTNQKKITASTYYNSLLVYITESGCYMELNTDTFQHKAALKVPNTPTRYLKVISIKNVQFPISVNSSCQDYCWAKEYTYFGVQANDCYCGYNQPDLAYDDKGFCDLPCPGDSSKKCGGKYARTKWTNVFRKDIRSTYNR